MSTVIHNTTFPLQERTQLALPEFLDIVHVDFDRDGPDYVSTRFKLWYLRRDTGPDAEMYSTPVIIYVVGTGQTLPRDASQMNHLRTLVDPHSPFVWHLWVSA